MTKGKNVVRKKSKAVDAKEAVAPTARAEQLNIDDVCMGEGLVQNQEKITVTVEKKPSVLFVGSEATPFIKTGGLADVLGSLPISLAERDNYDIRVILPLYGGMEEGFKTHLTYLCNFNVPVGWRNQYCGLFYYKRKNVTFYFVDNEYYFKRENLYGYYDDGERFAFFSRAVLESLAHLDYYPDILHCHDWQSALSVVYLKTLYANRSGFDKIRSIFTIHNIEYQGKYPSNLLGELFGLPVEVLPRVDYDGCINLMKGAMEFSDYVTTVSSTYAEEIKTPDYASGLQYAVNGCANKLCGIVNGIDVKAFDPATDKSLFMNYSVDDLEGKRVCKRELQKMLSLPVRDDVPVIGMITRLVSHKGLDLIKSVFEELLNEDVQIVILGKGDAEYENYFRYMADVYKGKVRAIIAYNKDMSSKIYSGSDMFLMPSKSEPCGLSQMIACRYATVPIVRATGGLNDTIAPFNIAREGGNGFVFSSYNAQEMLYVIKDAIFTYGNKPVWKGIMERSARTDFSWGVSAIEYEKLYNALK